MIKTADLFNSHNEKDFETTALRVFKFQHQHNGVYRSFCDLLYKNPSDITSLRDIPFLPISFFKTHEILSATDRIQKIFSSSGTTGSLTSKHLVTELDIYETSFTHGFRQFYGQIEDYTVLALLPSYLERDGSSLIYMVDTLIKQSKNPKSGFYLDNITELKKTLIESHQFQLKNTIVMETGGMKGRRKELVREELHALLKAGFGVSQIHSEYGMTELLSQAYSKGQGVFECARSMKVLARDTEDALSILGNNKTGGINVIDLANINSCAFIATQDLGRVYKDGTFEIIGRFDNSDIRGCNLMAL